MTLQLLLVALLLLLGNDVEASAVVVEVELKWQHLAGGLEGTSDLQQFCPILKPTCVTRDRFPGTK